MDPMEHMGLAIQIILERRPDIPRTEATSIAWEAVYETAKHFDPEKGCRPGTLLRWYVMSAMQKRGREDMSVVYQPQKNAKDNGRLVYIRDGLAELLICEDPEFSREDEYELMWKIAGEALDKRQLDMVKRHYVDGENYEEIGASYGLTRSRAQQIVVRSLELIREAYDDIDA